MNDDEYTERGKRRQMKSGKEELSELKWKRTDQTVLTHEVWENGDGYGAVYISEDGAMFLHVLGDKLAIPRTATIEEMQAVIKRIEELRGAE